MRVWAGACAGELLGLRGGLECSDLDYFRSALDGKRGALERQPTKHVRTHTHKLKPLNHFTEVPHPLFPLRFNKIQPPTRWASTRDRERSACRRPDGGRMGTSAAEKGSATR